MKSLSRVRLLATPWTAAYQAPPSMEFSRQEYWSGLPFPSPGDLLELRRRSQPSPWVGPGTQQWPQNWKRSVFIPIPKKANVKEYSNYSTVALISHASKVMLKILQARLQQYMNRELPDVQAGFRKGRGTREQIVNIRWICLPWGHVLINSL